jgi:cellulose synthase (UDP-forming)
VISWERVLFIVLQWPWVLWGCVMAVRDRVSGTFVDFRITPKGPDAKSRLPIKIITVYAVLALGAILPVFLFRQIDDSKGFLLLSLFAGALYVAVVVVTVWHHLSENGWRFIGTRLDGLVQMGAVVVLLGLLGLGVTQRSAESVYALSKGLVGVQLVELRMRVAGAGMGMAGKVAYQFNVRWLSTDQNL